MKMRSIMKKEMDKAGVKDPQVLDKSYWIQRVGEEWEQGDTIVYFLFPLLTSQLAAPYSDFLFPTSY